MKTPVLLRKSFIIEDEATFDDFFDVQETEKTSRSARLVTVKTLKSQVKFGCHFQCLSIIVTRKSNPKNMICLFS